MELFETNSQDYFDVNRVFVEGITTQVEALMARFEDRLTIVRDTEGVRWEEGGLLLEDVSEKIPEPESVVYVQELFDQLRDSQLKASALRWKSLLQMYHAVYEAEHSAGNYTPALHRTDEEWAELQRFIDGYTGTYQSTVASLDAPYEMELVIADVVLPDGDEVKVYEVEVVNDELVTTMGIYKHNGETFHIRRDVTLVDGNELMEHADQIFGPVSGYKFYAEEVGPLLHSFGGDEVALDRDIAQLVDRHLGTPFAAEVASLAPLIRDQARSFQADAEMREAFRTSQPTTEELKDFMVRLAAV